MLLLFKKYMKLHSFDSYYQLWFLLMFSPDF